MTTFFTRFLRVCFMPLGLAALGGPAWADGPQSPACQTAVAALREAENAIHAAQAASPAMQTDGERVRAVAAKLKPQRQRVADACLGGLTTSPPPSQRTLATPIQARPTPAVPQVALPTRPQSPTPVPRVEPPITVNQCNAVTCTASDGSTLTRVGPNLVGPRDTCTVQGAVLRCP